MANDSRGLLLSYFFVFQFSKPWPSLVYILPIISFAVIYNIPKFFELQVKSDQVKNFRLTVDVEKDDLSDIVGNDKLDLGEQNKSYSEDLMLVNLDTNHYEFYQKFV